MCFFFHDWMKWSEPYERNGFYGKWQDRLCCTCGKIETRLTLLKLNEQVARKLDPNRIIGPEVLPVPNYCTDIRAAWEIVEHFLREVKYLKSFEMARNNNSRWYVKFREESGTFHDAVADTAPEAICLAFLKV